MTQEPGPSVPMSERMQSLLSRAVEDQLSEQRQLAGALADVRAHLVRLGEELTEIRQVPPRDDQAFHGQLAGITSEIREAVRLINERLDTVDERVTRLAGDISELSDSNVGGTLMERIAGLERSVATFGPMIGEVGEASSTHATGLSGIEQRLDRLEESLRGLAGSVATGQGAAADGETVTALTGQLSSLQADLTALGSQLAGLAENAVDRTALQAATDAVQAAAQRSASIDDVVSQVGDLRVSVTGPSGVAARLEQLADELGANAGAEATDARIEESVRAAVQRSEQRLAAHIDEAVLALADALLRRRSTRAADAATSSTAVSGLIEDEDVGADIDEPTPPWESASPAPEEPTPEPTIAVVASETWSLPAQPGETPGAASQADDVFVKSDDDADDADKPRKKRWFRSGE